MSCYHKLKALQMECFSVSQQPSWKMVPALLEVGSFAEYWQPSGETRTVFITDVINGTASMARRYLCQDWDTGDKIQTFGCWLKAVPQVDMPDVPDWDQVPGEASTPKKVKVTQAEDPGRPKEKNRFVSMTDKELDQLAGASRSHNTHEQTKWGIKFLHGKCLFRRHS